MPEELPTTPVAGASASVVETPAVPATPVAPPAAATPVTPAPVVTPPVTPEPAKTNPETPATSVATVPEKTPEVTPPAADKIVPDKYDLKLPDGSQLTPAALTRIEEFAKANKLSNDEAQAALVRESATIASYMGDLNEQVKVIRTEWVKECQNDPEIGGANYAVNVENAKRLVQKFGSPKFLKNLDMTGYGNEPEFVRFCAKIGALDADDKAVMAGTQPSANTNPLQVMYDKQPKK